MRIQMLAAVLAIGCMGNVTVARAIDGNAIAQTVSPIQRLKAEGIPVVLPSHVPTGFDLTYFEMDLPGRFNGYQATYSGPDGCQISINGADGGWGGPSLRPIQEINTSLFGEIVLGEYELPSLPQRDELLVSFVWPSPEREVVPGFPRAGYIFTFRCENRAFSIQDALQILESMQVVE